MKPNKNLNRDFHGLELKAKETDNNNQFELSFSSEEPYLRSFGYEILSHSPDAVDLSRLKEIGVLLYNHDKDKVCGKILDVSIENGRGRALVEFDTDADSQKIADKVRSGTLKGVSVGYEVLEWEDVSEKGAEYASFKATKWKPYEISIVSIPADATVGVGRSMTENAENVTNNHVLEVKNVTEQAEKITNNDTKGENELENIVKTNVNTLDLKELKSMTNEVKATKPVENVAKVDTDAILKTERARIADINALCRDFGFDDDADAFIRDGSDLNTVRSAILEKLKTAKKPVDVKVQCDAGDNFRAAAVDALCMRAGVPVAKPAQGANELRSMSLRDLAIEALANQGMNERELRRMSPDHLYDTLQRDWFNPSSLFTSIMDTAIQKNIVDIYQKVPVTFDKFTTKGSVSDFKETKDHNYIIGGGAFEKVSENGELKASRPDTQILPTRKIDTYGTQFSMSRQAFINDDIGFLARVPGVYAAAAKRKINQQVYEILFNNGKIYDGVNLFDAKHANVAGTASKPTLASIQEMILKLQAQKDPFGEAINAVPAMLILPIGYSFEVDTLLHSASITTADSQNTGYNPLAGRGLTYIEDATLNGLAGTNSAPWFLTANPLTAKGIQVDYLNGNETPMIRRSEKAGQLGFVWDIFLDWGISVIDYRGIVKNAGAKITI